MIIIKHDDDKIKGNMPIYSVFSRLFGIRDEVFIVTFPRMQDEMDCSIKQVVMRNSEQNILLVDHSKFGQHTMKKFGDIKDFNTIITDSDISDEDQYNILKEKINLNITHC